MSFKFKLCPFLFIDIHNFCLVKVGFRDRQSEPTSNFSGLLNFLYVYGTQRWDLKDWIAWTVREHVDLKTFKGSIKITRRFNFLWLDLHDPFYNFSSLSVSTIKFLFSDKVFSLYSPPLLPLPTRPTLNLI